MSGGIGLGGRVVAAALAAGLAAATAAAAQDEPMVQGAAPTAQPLAVAGWDDHFFLQSPDGANRLEIGALLQVHGSFFERGLEARESDFFLRRFRLELGGKIEDQWLFNLEPRFTEDEFEFEEAWVGFDLEGAGDGATHVMIGRMKEPFSLEEVIPLKHLAFVNQSVLNQFVPAEGQGLTLYADAFERRFEWGAAVYRGGDDGFNDGTEGAGRVVLRPFAARASSPWRELQFGLAGTLGRADDELDGEELRTEAREPFATFAPGSTLDGDRRRIGAELGWNVGPFQLTAEAARIAVDVAGPMGKETGELQVWHTGAAWVLTGEERTFRGVRPEAPFRLRGNGGPGALELAARVSRLQIGDGFAESGVLGPTSDPRRVESLDIGLNWYASWRARVKLHWLFTRYAEEIDLGGDRTGDEQALLLQFQLFF